MTRPRSALAGLALAAIAAAGCGGQGDASQTEVADEVEERLVEDGYVAGPGADPVDVEAEDADAVGNCVARTMFEDTDEWSKDERNAATRTNDGDDPDPDLVVKVEALVNDCYDEVVGGGGAERTSDDDEAGGEDETTTTEAPSDDEETTTTSEG